MFFVKNRSKAFIFSGTLLVIFLASLALTGLNLGVHFGGLEIMFTPREEFTTEEVREVLADHGLEGATLQRAGGMDNGEGKEAVIIKTEHLSQEEQEALMKSLENRWPKMDPDQASIQSTGSALGGEQLQNALVGLVLALAAMIGYITLRFQFTYAVATIAALVHDIIMVLGVASLFQLEISIPFVAALLMVIGYSINDSIVIIDRIRENIKDKRKKDYPEVVNRSIIQNLTRSLNTSFTTMMVLVALLIGFVYYIGTQDLIAFVLALIIGVISGTYSSLFIAGPLWLTVKQREFRRQSPHYR